jgi:hypothetical protein
MVAAAICNKDLIISIITDVVIFLLLYIPFDILLSGILYIELGWGRGGGGGAVCR